MTMTPMRQLMGEVLRARRRAQGLTLRDLSSRARVSQFRIARGVG